MNKNLSIFYILFSSLLISSFSFGQNTFAPFLESEKIDACSKLHSHDLVKTSPTNPLVHSYDITFTKIDITSENNSSFIKGYAQVSATVVESELDNFVIELGSQMTVDSVFFDGLSTSFSHSGGEISVNLASVLSSGEQFSTIIYYHGNGHVESNYAGGMHFTSSNPDFNYQDMTYTFTQPFGANLWFPCKQVLSDKIDTLQMHITVPSGYQVSSNGVLKQTSDAGNNMTRYEWETIHPIAYYLVVFNVFNYSEYNFYAHPEGFEDSILIQNFMIDDTHINAMKVELDRTNDAMNLYCNLFGMYPFKDEKYGHSIWGHGFGMEHQTLTSMPYNIDFRRLSHELSHQWFGNLVTCATWQDIWLNEGFASYFDYLALKTIISNQAGEDRMDYYHERAMQADGSVYVPEEDANNASRIFNFRLSYCKGASAVKMLRFELQNDELFWQSLRNYLEIYKDSTATTDDLKTVFEETCNLDLSYFFDQWIYGEGYPRYSGSFYQRNDSLFISINQTVSEPGTTPFFKMLMEYKISHSSGDTIIRLNHEEPDIEYQLYFPQEVYSINIDPNNEALNEDYGMVNTTILELTPDGFQVFPNPVVDVLTIKNKGDNIISFEGILYDLKGYELIRFKTAESQYSINTNELKPAIYYLKIITAKGSYITKLIKY